MIQCIRTLSLSSVALAALLAAGSARAQAEDWQHVAAACTPSTVQALSQAQFNIARGSIRAPNANAGTLHYTCNVLDSFAGIVPVWSWLRLQAIDAAGGRVTASLYAKNKVNGNTTLLAVVNSVPSGGVAISQAPIPPINFAVSGAYVVISIQSSANNPPQAHMVMLQQ
jgi:hypothetical protein